MKRKTKAAKLNLDDQQTTVIQALTSELMTDEETDDDSGLTQRKLPWRSPEVEDLISLIDAVPTGGSGLQKPRKVGEESYRLPSKKIPQFMISPDYT